MNICVVVTTFRRPQYTKRVLQALSESYGIDNVAVLVGCDGVKPDSAQKEIDNVMQVREIVRGFVSGGKMLMFATWSKDNLGIDLHKLKLFDSVWKSSLNFDYIVLVEDDIVVSKDFIQYHKAMAERYKDDPMVMAVSAYQNTGADYMKDERNHYNIIRSSHFDCWGFGTWRGRWFATMGDGNIRYLQYAGEKANGLFDHYWESVRSSLGKEVIRPRIARCQNLVGQVGTDTEGQNGKDPSAEGNHNEFYWTMNTDPEKGWWKE